MIFLLSPAKSLDYETPPGDLPHTLPQFLDRSEKLIEVLRKKSPARISRLMDISDQLASLNVERYRAWSPKFTARNSKQAVLAFDGDVYDGLQARTLKPADLQWAQQHLCILSGLYGVLRPLDWMQPYRLEMGTALPVGKAKSLYQFWGSRIAEYLNERLAQDKAPVVVNLASQEYFRSVDLKTLKARVVECVFEEERGGTFKVVSFSAKKARGMMARHAIMKRMDHPRQLEGFDEAGYAFAPAVSSVDRLVFRRKITS